ASAALPPAESTLYRFLVQQGRPYSRHLAAILALSLLSAPLAQLTPVPLKVAIDSAVGSRPPPGFLQPFLGATHSRILIGVVILLLVVALLSELQQLALSQMRAYTGEQIVMRLRTRLFGHLQRLSLSYHDAQGTPDSVYRLQYDAATIRSVVVDGLIPLIEGRVTRGATAGVRARLRLVRLDGMVELRVGAITAVGSGAVPLIGVSHVRSGAMTLGDLVLILGYLPQLYDPLKTMSKQPTQVQ